MLRFTLLLLALLLGACGLEALPPASGDLPVGGYVIANLPPAQERGGELRPGVVVYRILPNETRAIGVAAVSTSLGLRARLRLALLDERGVVQAVSVARHWFAAQPFLAPLGLLPQITLDPGYRLNFRGQAGQAYYLRVENYALSEDRVTLYADPFTPNPAGNNPAENVEAFTGGTKEGAIEFVGEFDRYDVAGAPRDLNLRFVYTGPLDLVALLYPSADDPSPLTLDPVMNCAPISPATLLVVRDRGLVRAGFNEVGSGRYTLTLSSSPCP
ncbi:hypothetical protein [Thermus igniterrae]|jgi:hypothetical protein|uniref:hypothetical protein n=1 Tax=Thermus igniterrae TaxID=88189 RepID=UPI00035F1B45|nr:hypothetical protein [Thermus igniterrae]